MPEKPYMPNKPAEIDPQYAELVNRLAGVVQEEDDIATEREMDFSAYANGNRIYEPAIDAMAAVTADAYTGGLSLDESQIYSAVCEACKRGGHNIFLCSDVNLSAPHGDELKLMRTVARVYEKVASKLAKRLTKKPATTEMLASGIRKTIAKRLSQ